MGNASSELLCPHMKIWSWSFIGQSAEGYFCIYIENADPAILDPEEKNLDFTGIEPTSLETEVSQATA